LIKDQVENGHFPSKIMDFHHKICWQQQLVEDSANEKPSAEFALQYLRSHIYRIVLPTVERAVMEKMNPRKPTECVEVCNIIKVLFYLTTTKYLVK